MDYKETLNLPRSTFPMKANLHLREPDFIKKWEDEDIYHRMVQKNPLERRFVLHDGPPYANGHIHLGTALNKILKDIIVKYRNMTGSRCEFIPGWDCHGLPIEHQVEKEMGSYSDKKESPLDIRKRCRDFALKFMNIQRDEFRRLGVLGDWENPYLTMSKEYESVIAREFGRFVQNGIVYRSKMPVYWCYVCKTALAEAEVEYEDHESPSIYVKFPFKSDLSNLFPEVRGERVSILIWTTTPWTLPANLAIALNPSIEYSLIRSSGEFFILGSEAIKNLEKEGWLKGHETVRTFRGDLLHRLECHHPFLPIASLIILADFVQTETGTGCVHIAPGHGQEDYEIGMQYGLPVFAPVDTEGRFTDEVPQFKGKFVFSANEEIIASLVEKGLLLHQSKITHSYPNCWRSKNPIIFRATNQWFIDIDKTGLRRRAIEMVDQVRWIPRWGRERIKGMLENRPDWCISRQRVWGNPITVFYCSKCDTPLLSHEIIERISRIFHEEGSEAWFTRSVEELIPNDTTCPSCGGKEFRKETDILDVWFDSGVSWAAVLEPNPSLGSPCDLYLEGSDQHRGWFHSSLLASIGTRGHPPYKAVLTHGFVVDSEGRKMAKSLGNYIAPQEVIERYGAEILRLWTSAEDYRYDIRISDTILSRLAEAYRKIRNTARFLLGNLYDFDPARDYVPLDKLDELDRWALLELRKLIEKALRSYENYDFHIIYHSINQFCTVEMSTLYLDIVKDRLYTLEPDSPKRRGTQTALYEILFALTRLIAPILSFTAEEIYQHIPAKKKDSVFLEDMPHLEEDPLEKEIEEKFSKLLKLREDILSAVEKARTKKIVGHSLDCSVRISIPPSSSLHRFFEENLPLIKEFLIVSSLSLEQDLEGGVERGKNFPEMKIFIEKCRGNKCPRCWKYFEEEEPGQEVCPVCRRVLERSIHRKEGWEI